MRKLNRHFQFTGPRSLFAVACMTGFFAAGLFVSSRTAAAADSNDSRTIAPIAWVPEEPVPAPPASTDPIVPMVMQQQQQQQQPQQQTFVADTTVYLRRRRRPKSRCSV